MAQLPLIMIGRLPVLRKYPALGNVSLPGKNQARHSQFQALTCNCESISCLRALSHCDLVIDPAALLLAWTVVWVPFTRCLLHSILGRIFASKLTRIRGVYGDLPCPDLKLPFFLCFFL